MGMYSNMMSQNMPNNMMNMNSRDMMSNTMMNNRDMMSNNIMNSRDMMSNSMMSSRDMMSYSNMMNNPMMGQDMMHDNMNRMISYANNERMGQNRNIMSQRMEIEQIPSARLF